MGPQSHKAVCFLGLNSFLKFIKRGEEFDFVKMLE